MGSLCFTIEHCTNTTSPAFEIFQSLSYGMVTLYEKLSNNNGVKRPKADNKNGCWLLREVPRIVLPKLKKIAKVNKLRFLTEELLFEQNMMDGIKQKNLPPWQPFTYFWMT